jgi:hypothetical protein
MPYSSFPSGFGLQDKITAAMQLARDLSPFITQSPQTAAKKLDALMDRYQVDTLDRYIAAARILFGSLLLPQAPKNASIDDIAKVVNAMTWVPLLKPEPPRRKRTTAPLSKPASLSPVKKEPTPKPVVASTAFVGINLVADLIPKILSSESFHFKTGIFGYGTPLPPRKKSPSGPGVPVAKILVQNLRGLPNPHVLRLADRAQGTSGHCRGQKRHDPAGFRFPHHLHRRSR